MRGLWLRLRSYPRRNSVPLRGQASAPTVTPPEGSSSSNFGLWNLLQAGCLSYVIFHYCMSSSLIVGLSMHPTFHAHGDVVLVEKLTHKLHRLRPGVHRGWEAHDPLYLVACSMPTGTTTM